MYSFLRFTKRKMFDCDVTRWVTWPQAIFENSPCAKMKAWYCLYLLIFEIKKKGLQVAARFYEIISCLYFRQDKCSNESSQRRGRGKVVQEQSIAVHFWNVLARDENYYWYLLFVAGYLSNFSKWNYDTCLTCLWS